MDLVGRSPDVVAYFYSVYHCQSELSVKLCHELTVREAKQRGWAWSSNYGATHKWLKLHDKVSMTLLLREGGDAWCRRYMPHHEIDYTLIQPGQLYQADHHQCDFWVEYDGKQIRPWLTVTQDDPRRFRNHDMHGVFARVVPDSDGTTPRLDRPRAAQQQRNHRCGR